jgi:glucose-6-phosphate isomerase
MSSQQLPVPYASDLYTHAVTHFDPVTGTIDGLPTSVRRLSDLRGYFADSVAYDSRLAQDDPVLYTIASVDSAQGDGQLHYGLGLVMPGRIGEEYYMTKGHYHAWRPAAEVYIGLSGTGLMLLEDEQGGSNLISLTPNSIVYVPGYTAHRTINTGDAPLVYLGIYPASAGHDYGAIAERNFLQVVVAVDNLPTMLSRSDYLARLAAKQNLGEA